MTAAARQRRHRRFTSYAATLAAVFALVAVTGCTGREPVPTVTTPAVTSTTTTASSPPATTTTSTPTKSVDPVLAKIPAAARRNTEAGGAAYTRFYFAQLNNAFRSGDTSLIDSLATKSCVTCVAFSAGVKELHDKGRRYGADLVEVVGATALNFTDGKHQILVEIHQDQVPVLDESGSRLETTPGGKATFVASLDFASKRWVLTRLQKAAS